MASVTNRISKILIPTEYDIYLDDFVKISYHDDIIIKDIENIDKRIVGSVVDNMVRLSIGIPKDICFRFAISGAKKAIKDTTFKDAYKIANELLDNINDLSDSSLISACKIINFEDWFYIEDKRDDIENILPTYRSIKPNKETLDNIRLMINRTLAILEVYKPIRQIGFDFKPNGYTDIITSGEGDFLMNKVLLDLKVSSFQPNIQNLMQIMTYYRMGLHSGQDCYKKIEHLGILNPKRNEVYLYDCKNMNNIMKNNLDRYVIGYEEVE